MEDTEIDICIEIEMEHLENKINPINKLRKKYKLSYVVAKSISSVDGSFDVDAYKINRAVIRNLCKEDNEQYERANKCLLMQMGYFQ